MRALFIFTALAVVACGGSDAAVPTQPTGPVLTSIVVTPATASVSEGDTVRLTAVAKDAAGKAMSSVAITWTSSTPNLTVESSGLVHGVAKGGPFSITASSGSVSGSASLTVLSPTIGSFLVTPAAPSISQGDSVKLTATAKDKNGTVLSLPVTWSVPPFSIVTVDQTGFVKSLGTTGSASVNASVQGSAGVISTVVTVTVTAAPLAAGSLYFGAVRSAFAGGPLNREINVINPNTLVESDLTANPSDDDFPVVSPDGQFLWFFTYRFVQKGEYVIMKKDGTGVKRLFTGCQWNDGGVLFNYCVFPTAWLPDSRLVYTISDKNVPSLTTILLSNVLTPSTGAVAPFTGAGSSAFSNFSPSGTLGFNLFGNGLLQIIRMSDGVTTTLAPACTFTTACGLAAWAANEKSIFAFREGALYEFPVDGSASRKMYTATGTPSELAASPDGSQIAFIEGGSLKIIATTGTATPKVLAASTGQIAWSPDGKSVAFSASQFDNGIPDQIWGINVTGTGKKKITDINFLRGLSWGK